MTATIWRDCAHCGIEFGQPDDPGRKRRYCSDACKQAAYRARKRAEQQAQHEQTRREEEARRARAREDTRRRYRYEYQPSPPRSGNGHGGSAERARIRRIIEGLLRKAASTSFPHEADACRAKAEYLRRKYNL